MICRKCGHEATGNFCNHCGASLNLQMEEDPEENFQREYLDENKEAEEAELLEDDYIEEKRISRKRQRTEGRKRPSGRKVKRGRSRRKGKSIGHKGAQKMGKILVFASRCMQLISFVLMAGMTGLMTWTFWTGREGLGSIETMAADKNYSLAVYLGAAAGTVLIGLIWSLWILSKKSFGGEVRLKKYDVGRGFLPFLLCAAAVFVSGIALNKLPENPEQWRDMAGGLKLALGAVDFRKELLYTCSFAGAGFSLARKLLRV